MKKLYLVRHGETLFNQLGKIQGACDSPLTEKGIYQAEKVKAYIDTCLEVPTTFYSSTQERASDTLEVIIGEKKYNRVKGLKEWHFGIFEGESERINPKIPAGESSFKDSFVPYGGESSESVQDRMNDTITGIMNIEENQNVLMVSHGGAMYMFLKKWLSNDEVSKVKFSNGCILEFNYENSMFKFQQVINPDW